VKTILTRPYENQSVHRAVSKLVKTAINTAITVKLLKSKVTLLNTCEKLKMTQRDTGNIKSKVNETCYCETCHN
jgi:low affinity Fe/Cu permease